MGDVLGSALGDDFATFFSSLWTDVDDVVGGCHDVGVVLDDDDGVSFVNEAVEDEDELFDIVGVETDAWLLDEVEVVRLLCAFADRFSAFCEFANEFDALGFAT